MGSCCSRVPSHKSFLAQALGSHTEAEGAAVVPQILQCQVCGGGPLAANPLSLVAAACPCS